MPSAVMTAPDHPLPRNVRSPVDVVRLILGVGLMAGGLVAANLFDSALLGLSEDGAAVIDDLPAWLQDIPAASLAGAVIVAIAAALVWSMLTTRFRRFAMLAIGFASAALLSIGMGELVYEVVDDPVRSAFDTGAPTFRYRGIDGRLRPGDPLLAGALAMLLISASFLPLRAVRRIAGLLAGYAIFSVVSAGVPALGLVADVGAGIVVASLVLLAFGRHDLAPDRPAIRSALDAVGVRLASLERLGTATRWVGTTSDGDDVGVKVLGRDDRSADLLSRSVRWIRARQPGDRRPHVSLQRAVEHEALVSLQAAALGIRTPRIVGVGQVGVDGGVIAYELIDGDVLGRQNDIDDVALKALWRMVDEMHSKQIAHGDLRLDNVLIDDNGQIWLTEFAGATLGAGDEALGTDVVELLAATAAVVGAERAVAAARAEVSSESLERALPWMQPLALSRRTRDQIGGADGLAAITAQLTDQCGLESEELVRLARVNGKTLFIIATIGLSAWFLIPQLADIDNIWQQAREASRSWAAVAVAFSMVTYFAATAALLGAIPMRLRFWPALLAQVAASFANRVTPAKVGGIATNIRYFQRQGVPAAVSVTAVGLNAIVGVVVHISLTFGFLLMASGDQKTQGISLPSATIVMVFLMGALAVVGTSLSLRRTRQLVKAHVVPQLESGWLAIQEISHSVARIALLFGGSAVITLAYLGAMVASLKAFDSTASLPIVALLFLTASAVANAAPTPGGLGAAEAALIAALSTVEDAGVVIPAVFLFRLVTFWLPILPGWFALTFLRHTGDL